ncbi:MAG: 3'-5' exonuclease domain-containing protein 2 [Brachymonas sp.]|nr:3'-5' exonuclease domain-containing protein 2 [Brachymonas sp.]
MPLFDRIDMQRISCVTTAAQASTAAEQLKQASVWGFDTESKPTFRVGEISTGPHVLQLSTLQHAWVFQLHDMDCRAVAAELLAMPGIVKAGFGLRDDQQRIRSKLGIEPQGIVEINTLFRKLGYRKELGVKAAVAVLFKQRFVKSKKASTSNWALPHLSEQQLMYAANDAYAAARVWYALQTPHESQEANEMGQKSRTIKV